MTILIPDSGVADLLQVYSVREFLLRRHPALQVSVASTHPQLTIETNEGPVVLELTGGQWLITAPGQTRVRIEPDASSCALAALEYVADHLP